MPRLFSLVPAAVRVALALALAGPAQAGNDPASCLPGFYDGGQTEIAAALKLNANGRFDYALAYGALDEVAAGTWQLRDGAVLLTSDPVTPPAYELLGEGESPDGALHIELEVPDGFSRQYFDAELTFANGSSEVHQFDEEGYAFALSGENRPVAVRVLLPVYDLSSETYPLDDSAAKTLRVRFVPNDLGTVAFAGEALVIDEGDLLLDRHARHLRFQPVEGGCRQPASD